MTAEARALLDALLAVADAFNLRDAGNVRLRCFNAVARLTKHLAVIQRWISAERVGYDVVIVEVTERELPPAPLCHLHSLAKAVGSQECVTLHGLGELATAHTRALELLD